MMLYHLQSATPPPPRTPSDPGHSRGHHFHFIEGKVKVCRGFVVVYSLLCLTLHDPFEL